MAEGTIQINNRIREYLVQGTSFSFPVRHTNEGYLIIGESGVVAPFIYMVGIGGGETAATVNKILDPYGLAVTASLSNRIMTITFNVSVTTFIKVIG